MKRLSFSKDYRRLVKEGKKTQTIRYWKRPLLKKGELCRSADIGIIEVTSVDRIELSSLSEQDAHREGFKSLNDLLRVLRRIYGVSKEGYSFYRVRFRLLPEKDPILSDSHISSSR